MIKFSVIIWITLLSGAQSHKYNPLKILYNLTQLDFAFPSKKVAEEAIEKGYYIPHDYSHNVPIDVDVHYDRNGKNRIFVAIPRFYKGLPITLGTIDMYGVIHGYPSYAWNDDQGHNCDGLTSVFRTMIDRCGRFWVVDTGKIGYKYYCPPQLLAFNLVDDSLVYRHRLHDSPEHSLYVTPVVDVRNEDCSGTFVYLADVAAFGLTVVDVDSDHSWHIKHRLFYPYPDAGTFVINDQKFDLMDGLLGLALSPVKDLDRILYFHALASVTENAVLTSTLRDKHLAEHAYHDSIWRLPGHRQNQSAAQAMDRNGTLYFGIMSPPSIWCWNSNTEFMQRNFHPIARDGDTLQFASGIKIITNSDGDEELWVMTNNIQRLFTQTMDNHRVNFRIHMGLLKDIMRNSPCNSPIDNETIQSKRKSTGLSLAKDWRDREPNVDGWWNRLWNIKKRYYYF